MVRVHSGLPFQVPAPFSTCDSPPVFFVFTAPAVERLARLLVAIFAATIAFLACYHSYMRANVRVSRSGDTCRIPCFKESLVRKLRRQLPPDSALEEVEILFGALADRARLKILFALRNGEELCVCDVSHVLGATISTASHHLRKLRDLKLLKYRNDGKMAYYSLRDELAGRLVADTLEEVGT